MRVVAVCCKDGLNDQDKINFLKVEIRLKVVTKQNGSKAKLLLT